MDLTGAGAAASGGVPAVGPFAAPESIASLIRIAQGDAQKLQKEIEDWFNATMDRLSGWYKRKTQLILLVLSVVTVVLFNINTIHIGEVLWSQPAQRATIAQQAGASGSTVSVKQALDAATSFPIGWSKPDRASTVWEWILLILGWIISIGALTLGAPFWFDLLTKLGSLRSTGPPPKPT
jgi:hypothetical protein